jgi:hypothetical protein
LPDPWCGIVTTSKTPGGSLAISPAWPSGSRSPLNRIRSPATDTSVAIAALLDTEPARITRRGHSTRNRACPTRHC